MVVKSGIGFVIRMFPDLCRLKFLIVFYSLN